MLVEYVGIVVAIIVALMVACLFYILSYLLIFRDYSLEKLTGYECGFGAFADSRDMFDVRFYLVAILFLVFDLEIVFLFPWCMVVGVVGCFGFVVMCIFLLVLGVGFYYEWVSGALEW